jgi:hypothetical protein
MLHIYSRDRYVTTLSPVAYAQNQKLNQLFMHLFERLEAFDYEIGEYICHDGDRLLRAIFNMHDADFKLDVIASDYELLEKLFTKDLIELNKFEPCTEAQKDRPHLDADSPFKKLKIKKSGNQYMDDLADLAIMLGSYESANLLINQLTQTELDHFVFRYGERNRTPESLLNEQNKEYFAQWMQDDFGKDYLRKALNGQ